MLFPGKIEWHDLEIAPEDLPGAGEPIIATVEMTDGERRVWLDTYLKELDNDKVIFCTTCKTDYGTTEECAMWYPVIAWAYPPEPLCLRF